MTKAKEKRLAILAWEETLIPKGLDQLGQLVGNSTHPDTFDFPLDIVRVAGARWETILVNPDQEVLGRMIDLAQELEKKGYGAITTSCGFNAIFQEDLARSVKIPVLSSSLLQIPYIQAIIGTKRPVPVVTASSQYLTEEHFAKTGTQDLSQIYVYGMEDYSSEWKKVNQEDQDLDLDRLKEEIGDLADLIVKEHPQAGAILLECTDLPPFADLVRERTGLPVFDFVSMMENAYQVLDK
ncbi:MAG: aspartate/glutamate racemase family protein [Tissierellia bacterium]|nr:aspartate/glutamate racemase family protein [Tissierellia bacterium]